MEIIGRLLLSGFSGFLIGWGIRGIVDSYYRHKYLQKQIEDIIKKKK